jgi:hypothetical protein
VVDRTVRWPPSRIVLGFVAALQVVKHPDTKVQSPQAVPLPTAPGGEAVSPPQ